MSRTIASLTRLQVSDAKLAVASRRLLSRLFYSTAFPAHGFHRLTPIGRRACTSQAGYPDQQLSFPSAATEHNAYRRASPGGREGLVVEAGDSRGFTALGTVVVCSGGGGFTSVLHAHCVRNERVFAVAHVVDWPAARAAGQKHRQQQRCSGSHCKPPASTAGKESTAAVDAAALRQRSRSAVAT